MEVVVTGGTGLIGKALTEALLHKGYKVCILTRNIPATPPQKNIEYSLWDISNKIIDAELIKRADYIIHLAGAGIADERWTPKYKERILKSRVEGGRLLSDAIALHGKNLKGIVCASATGWYGADQNENAFIETDPPATDFIGEVCRQWEESVQVGSFPLAYIRTGIVLSNNGGAYPKMTKPIRFGVAPILGKGKQVMSWIHINDLVRIYIMAMENNWNGSFNAVSPTPVTNRFFVNEAARVMKGKFFISFYVPAFFLKLIIGGSANEILKSCTVSCEKVKSTGFTYLYPTLTSCLSHLTNLKVVP